MIGGDTSGGREDPSGKVHLRSFLSGGLSLRPPRCLRVFAALLAFGSLSSGAGAPAAATAERSGARATRSASHPSRAGAPEIEPAVLEAVASGKLVRVNIMLGGGRPLPPNATSAEERSFTAEIARGHAAIRSSLHGRGVTIVSAHTYTSGLVADVDSSGLGALERDPRVERVYLDREVHAMLAEGVPLMKGDALWGLGFTGAGLSVAVLDSGIDYTHPALGGCFGAACKVVAGYDFANND